MLVTGRGGKSFCSGGDVKGAVEAGRAGDSSLGIQFFREEYTLNYLVSSRPCGRRARPLLRCADQYMPSSQISEFPKAYVSILDGYVMGGGNGVSIHGTYRVATEKSVFAMPECLIGLNTDIGATHFLSRLPGHLGLLLGITGMRLNGVEMARLGLATHYVPSDRVPALVEGLSKLRLDPGDKQATCAAIDRVLRGAAEDLGTRSTPLLDSIAEVERALDTESLEEAVRRIEQAAASGRPWAQQAMEAFGKQSPLSTHTAWVSIRSGGVSSLAGALRTEFRVVTRCMTQGADFFEGVRALLIDKDNKPNFRHKSVFDVPKAEVDAMLAPLEGIDDLDVPCTLPWAAHRGSSKL